MVALGAIFKYLSLPNHPPHSRYKVFFTLYLLLAINSLPNDRFLPWSKLKAFADDKLNLAEKLEFLLIRVENIVGKGENAGYQHFLLFPQCFQQASISGSLKVEIV